ncbi:peptide-methionine (S)-S-oxide reductase MsrA [Flavobacterium jejuense]|uniref:Peptide methionine sulfoxide reductase MsrA n=1 Tax=Flavobacterium jejuense TaxID=1544455 RepID=A0ABX0IPS1_9FLAO|nr:peptide-methionine (S)-S-oxide reductase MsrA [Flavobacterium jejuense]NHN25829.1 peptide-methionine (S)-S-oxide reductase MsrA [Flavobacterium jejuense]
MKKIKTISYLIISFLALNCQSNEKKNNHLIHEQNAKEIEKIVQKTSKNLGQYETAYFASGCFWCVEAVFESVKGVKEVVSGYSGGSEPNPTYEKVSSGKTGYAEAVKIYYDPNIISFSDLVIVFFGSHDPTTLNQQGPDKGTQYRSIAFYKTETEKKVIEDYINKLNSQKVYGQKSITTEVKMFSKFYEAEAYHQNYESLHPNNSYIINVSLPRINKFKNKFPNYLK